MRVNPSKLVNGTIAEQVSALVYFFTRFFSLDYKRYNYTKKVSAILMVYSKQAERMANQRPSKWNLWTLGNVRK